MIMLLALVAARGLRAKSVAANSWVPATMTTVFPDLARSAVEAVGYERTLLHGVPIDTRITINVTLRP